MTVPIPTPRGLAAAIASFGVVACLIGCETPLDRAWRKSQEAHVARSIANPDAGTDDLEAKRPDGVSTDAALTRLRQAEKGQQATPESVINVDLGG